MMLQTMHFGTRPLVEGVDYCYRGPRACRQSSTDAFFPPYP